MGKRSISVFIVLSLVLLSAFSFGQATGSKIKTIVIDAGHGGKDPGNLGTGRYKTTEKHIVLDISIKLGDYIKEAFPDIEVIYTRDKDVFIGLNERAKLANDNKADLFISIHCNAFKNPESHGTESWVMGMHKTEENLKIAQKENSVIFLEDDYEAKYDGFDPNSPESYIALVIFQNAFINQSLDLASKVQRQFKTRVGRIDRGVKQAGFVVISKTTMPAILVELGFLTNKEEEDFLNSENGKVYMASAIFRAFKEYKQEYETPDVVDTAPASGKTEEEKKAEQKKQEELKKQEEAKKKELEEKKKAEAEAKKKEEERKRKEEAHKKAEADSLAKVEADKKAKLRADSIAKAEADKKAKLKADSITKVEADKKAKLKVDSLAKIESEKKAKLKADSVTMAKAAIKATEEKAKFKADSIAKIKEQEKLKTELAEKKKKEEKERKAREAELAKLKQDSLVKLKAREEALKDSLARMLAEAEMSKQQSLWVNVDKLSKNALDSRADFQHYVDACVKLDDYLWQQSTEKDKTEAWKARRANKEYQKIYFAFELGKGKNVETFKALTFIYPENSKYVDERAFAMYEEYINDKIKHEIHGGTYELVDYKKLTDAAAQALKEELRKEADAKAVHLADSIAKAEKVKEEKMRIKRDSLKNELQKFREEQEEKEEVKPVQEVIEKKEKEVAFNEKKEELINKIKPPSETIAGNKNIVFKVQLASSAKQIPLNSPRFNGIPVKEYKDGSTYKYTTGETRNIDEASALQKEVRTKGFNDAFVVAFLNGERIPVSKAREILNIN